MPQKDAPKMDTKPDTKKENEEPALPPDPETLHKTDPQDNMEGPVSSLMQKARETMEHNDQEVPEEDEDDEQEKKEDE